MSLFDDQNKTEITKQITAATCFWLDERGVKPTETEVTVAFGWIADIAGVLSPTETELQTLKLIRRKPTWKKPQEEKDAWQRDADALNRMMTVIVEVKTSRNDFRGDKKWTMELPADLCWVAAPAGLIAEAERPKGWGILEYSDKRDCMISRCVPSIGTTTAERQRNLIHAVACRRDNHTRYEHINRLRKEYREEDKRRESLTRVKDAMRAALSIARGEHGSVEGALEYHRIKLRSLYELEITGLTALWGVAKKETNGTA
jgi:hypothetical protein